MPPVTFAPGRSGNPGGRPKSRATRALLQRKYGQDGEELIRRLDCFSRGVDPETEKRIKNFPARERVGCTETLLAYLVGRPPQAHDVGSDPDHPILTKVIFGGRYKP